MSGKNIMDNDIYSHILTVLEGARSNAGDAYAAKDINSLKANIKEVETYFEDVLEGKLKKDCQKVYSLVEEGLQEVRNAYETDDMSQAKESAKACMEKSIKAMDALKACYQ